LKQRLCKKTRGRIQPENSPTYDLLYFLRALGCILLTSEQIKNLPTRSVNTIVATNVGAASIDGGDVNIKGSRSKNIEYYIDGIRVTGGVPPVQDLEQLRLSKTKGPHAQPVYMGRFSRAREFYAPKYASDPNPTQRNDFRSTIYWNPSIATDKKGEAEVLFFCSDAITNFRASVEGMVAKRRGAGSLYRLVCGRSGHGQAV